MSFFISPLLSTPDLHSFLGLSIPVFLHPSLSFHFFLPGESPSHCWNISWAAEKMPLSSQLACQHLLCLCNDLWSDFWFYRASDGDLLTFSLGFSLEANLLNVLWCEDERSVRKWMVRLSSLCGFEWAEHVCGRWCQWLGEWGQVFVYKISDTMKQMYFTSEQHLLWVYAHYSIQYSWSGSRIFFVLFFVGPFGLIWILTNALHQLLHSWFPLHLPLPLTSSYSIKTGSSFAVKPMMQYI